MSRADLEAIQSIYGDLMEHPSEEESKGLILDKAIGLSMTVDQVQAKIEAEEARAIKNNRKLIHSEDPRLGAGKRNWTKIHRKNIDALGAMPNSVGGGASKNRSSPTGQTPNSSQQKKKVEATVLRTLTPKDESAAVMMKLIAPQAPKIDTSTPMSNFLSEKIQKVRALRLAEKRMKEREEGGNISSKSEGPDINNYLGSRLSLNISKSDTADKSGDSKRSSPPSSSIQAPPIFLEQPLDAPDFAGSLASRSSATISLHDDHSNDKADQEVVENEDQTPEHAGYRTLLNVDSFSGAGAGGSRSRRGSNVGSETSKNRKKLEDVHHLSTKKYEEIYGDYPKGGREEEHDEVEDHQYYTLPELRDKAKQKVKVALKTARKKTPNNPKPPPKYAQRGSTVNKFIAAAINPPAGSSMDDESSEEDSDDDSDEEGSVNSQLYQQAVPNALLKIPATATAPIQPKIKKPLQIQEEKAAKPKKMKPQPPPSVMPKEPSRDELYNPKITVDAQYLRAERETWNLLKMLTEKKQDMVNKEFEALSGTDWFPGMMVKREREENGLEMYD